MLVFTMTMCAFFNRPPVLSSGAFSDDLFIDSVRTGGPLDPEHAVYIEQFKSPSGRINALYHRSALAPMAATHDLRDAPPEVKAYMRARQKPKSASAVASSSYSWEPEPVVTPKAVVTRKVVKPRAKVPRKKKKAHKIDFLPGKLTKVIR